MVMAPFKLQEDYWEKFQLQEQDIEILYNHLLETETPLTNKELLEVLIAERVRLEKHTVEEQRSSGSDIYYPKDRFNVNQKLVFPSQGWRRGQVTNVRLGNNPDLGKFEVVRVKFQSGEEGEYAAGLEEHVLNNPPVIEEDDDQLSYQIVLQQNGDELSRKLEESLQVNDDFVRIAGRWFPRALLVDINMGHLNLAEAVLDMSVGGPLPTRMLLDQLDISSKVSSKLLEFSLDFALEEDPRFDEVGAAGETLWFLHRLEPQPVLEPPLFLRYQYIDYDHSQLTQEMLALERDLDDELSSVEGEYQNLEEVDVCLIYPHWRVGTLPLSSRTRHIFPTAYEAPRIRFTIVDGETGEKFPAWVVRPSRYVYGLKDWYEKRGLIPGSMVNIQKGKEAGEVIIQRDARRAGREWIRTLLIGSDGGIVFAMLKHIVQSKYDERMAIAIPDIKALDGVWEQMHKERPPFERVVVNMVRELTKLNPQGHVHASELYAAVNITRRCPPGPIIELLASRPWFIHVGDLHFRFSEIEHP